MPEATDKEVLVNQCMRLMHGQCSTLFCLSRGGYKRGDPVDYSAATCPYFEVHKELTELREYKAKNPPLFFYPTGTRQFTVKEYQPMCSLRGSTVYPGVKINFGEDPKAGFSFPI